MAVYHFGKIVSISILLYKCNATDNCQQVSDNYFDVFLLFDSILLVICFTYFFYVMFLLILRTRKAARFEYLRHRYFIFVFGAGILICLPLVLLDILFWVKNYSDYPDRRMLHYGAFIAHTLPSLLQVLLKPNEDCLNCFNRVCPQQYSIFQFTNLDLLVRQLDGDE